MKLKSTLSALALGMVVIAGLAAWIVLPWPVMLALALALAGWMLGTRSGRQAGSVTRVGVSTLPQRLGASSVVVVGIAGVVAVLVALLAMAEGYRQTVASTGDERTAIVLRGGSGAEVLSVLSRETVVTIAQAPQVARNADNVPLASAELVVAASLTRRGPQAEDGSVQLRGGDPIAWEVRPRLRIIEGRAPQCGPRGQPDPARAAGRGRQRAAARGGPDRLGGAPAHAHHRRPGAAVRPPRAGGGARRAPAVRRAGAGRRDPPGPGPVARGGSIRIRRCHGIGDLGRRRDRRHHLPPRQQPQLPHCPPHRPGGLRRFRIRDPG